MLRLAFLLIGIPALRRYWALFALAGVLWSVLGIVIIGDLFDGVADIAVETLGFALLVEGLFGLVSTGALGHRYRRFDWIKNVAFIIAALLVLDFPWNNQLSFAVILGGTFLLSGTWRTTSACLIRYQGWQRSLGKGLWECFFGLFVISPWPLPYEFNSRIVLGIGMLLAGWNTIRLGKLIRHARADARQKELHLFRNPSAQEEQFTRSGTETPEIPPHHLLVRIWGAVETADTPRFLPVVSRYIAALSRSGKISTGHAVLDMAPAVYISHYPLEEIEVPANQFAHKLNAGSHNNIPGRFIPDYATEITLSGPCTQTVTFNYYHPAQLQAFWNNYRRNTTYNLTDRNCSVAVEMGLDAALEGTLAHRNPLWILLKLLLSSDLWVAASLRNRAESMVWTPGLVLDYSRLLARIIDRLAA